MLRSEYEEVASCEHLKEEISRQGSNNFKRNKFGMREEQVWHVGDTISKPAWLEQDMGS